MSTNTAMIQGISEQYGAALKMLENAIVECNEEIWQDFTQEIVISQVVYHTLSSTDFFLSKNKDESDSFKGKYGDDDGSFHEADKNYTKNQLTEYLNEIKEKAYKRFSDLTIQELNDDSLFDWHGSSVLSSLLYNLRHLMLHVGALHVRLNAVGKEPLRWVSKIYGDERDKRDEMNGRGVSYLQQGKLDEAERIYLELTSNSEEPVYFYNLSCCYSLQGNAEKSLKALEICLTLDKKARFKTLAKKDNDFANIRELVAFKDLLNS